MRRSPRRAANLVADPVHDRLAKVGLQCPLALRLKDLNPIKRLKEGLLDKILRVGEVSRPFRKPSSCPALQPRQVPSEKQFERLSVTAAKALNEVERGFRLAGGCDD